MATVRELQPGDLVTLGTQTALYITDTPHPLWPGLRLVIWRMSNGTSPEWYHDALQEEQEVGDVTPSTSKERHDRLAKLFLTGGTT